jgi:chromosome segregation ATPase
MAQTRIEIEKAQAEAAELADQLADDLDTSKANLNVAKGQIDNLKESMLLAEAQAKREIEAMTEKMAASHEKAHTSQAALAESRKRADELAAMLTTADQARIHADQAKATAEQTAAVLAAKLDAAEQLKVNYEKEITTLMQRELEAINRADIAEKHASDLATDRDMAVMSAAEARERTAKLAGQLEATLTQNAALLAQLVPPKPVKAIKQPNPTQPNLINK